ncbi:MAG: branched-chain amino acid ABC transporter permease [Candidatus Rokubacteria bacterium]|nr:branched-chain amino acid ABC transporter permease [Candidatus Rokubacteria bacterium]
MRWALSLALLVLVILPNFLGSYLLTVFIFIFFYAYLGQAWNLLGGYGGQISLGHAAFVGVGAYTSTYLSMTYKLSPWIGMFIGGAAAALLGGVIGYLGFRFGLRGFYFILLTVAFAEICRLIVSHLEPLGGALGLFITFTGNPWQFQFSDNRSYYYIALGMMLASVAIVGAVERSRMGAYLVAIREDEDASEALGVNAFATKLAAIVLSAFLTGMGGTFYANYLFSLQPNTAFGIPLSVEIILRPIVGGSGTLVGPILGSFILSPLAEVSRAYFARGGLSGVHLIIYGSLLIAVVLFFPRGAYPYLRGLLRRLPRRGAP